MTINVELENQIEKERENARAVCERHGKDSKECAAAMDALEELMAEASHQRDVKPKSPQEKYCDENPEAAGCLLYDT